MQKDDGSRNALIEFMKDKDANTEEVLKLFLTNSQYWKARVFLEMVWELDLIYSNRN